MSNYLLRNLNVVLKSDDPKDTSTVEMIVEFDTLYYGAKFNNEETTGGHIKLSYEIDPKKKAQNLFHNGFIYSKQINWIKDKILTITDDYTYQEDTESSAVTKGEEDVIKPSEPGSR